MCARYSSRGPTRDRVPIPRLARALRGLELLVVVDVIDTDTTPLATHLWPAAGQLERATCPGCSTVPARGSKPITPAVVCPAHDRRPVWRMFADSARRSASPCYPRESPSRRHRLNTHRAHRRRKSRRCRSVVGGRHGTVHSGAVFGWVPTVCCPATAVAGRRPRDRVARASNDNGVSDRWVLIPHRQLRKMNSQFRDVAAPGGRVGRRECADASCDARSARRGRRRHGRRAVAHGSTSGPVRVDSTIAPRRGGNRTWFGPSPNVCDLTSADQKLIQSPAWCINPVSRPPS